MLNIAFFPQSGNKKIFILTKRSKVFEVLHFQKKLNIFKETFDICFPKDIETKQNSSGEQLDFIFFIKN